MSVSLGKQVCQIYNIGPLQKAGADKQRFHTYKPSVCWVKHIGFTLYAITDSKNVFDVDYSKLEVNGMTVYHCKGGDKIAGKTQVKRSCILYSQDGGEAESMVHVQMQCYNVIPLQGLTLGTCPQSGFSPVLEFIYCISPVLGFIYCISPEMGFIYCISPDMGFTYCVSPVLELM